MHEALWFLSDQELCLPSDFQLEIPFLVEVKLNVAIRMTWRSTIHCRHTWRPHSTSGQKPL
jgi:hypothetical protein